MALFIVAVVGLLLFVMIWMTCNLLWVQNDRIKNDDAVAKVQRRRGIPVATLCAMLSSKTHSWRCWTRPKENCS